MQKYDAVFFFRYSLIHDTTVFEIIAERHIVYISHFLVGSVGFTCVFGQQVTHHIRIDNIFINKRS